jgi:hypothetical protein
MPAPANLIHETSTTTGTGNLTVAAVNGKVRFSDSTYGFGTGGSDVFWYFISNQSAAEWEIGTGSMSDANTLVRDTILFSSNSDNAVSFSAGTKDVTNDVPAASQITTEHVATQAQQETGSSTAVFVSPGRQHFHPGHPKCWLLATVSGGTPSNAASYNITSIADTAVGRLTVTIATDFSSESWVGLTTFGKPTGVSDFFYAATLVSKAAGSVIIEGIADGTGFADPLSYNFAGLGDLA